MKEASRRSNLASSKGNFSPERGGRENEKFMRPPDDRRGRDDAHRSRDSDRGDQRRDDGSRRRDYEREDRNRDQDRKESDRRGKRDDFNRDERDRRDDRSRDIRKERETSDRGRLSGLHRGSLRLVFRAVREGIMNPLTQVKNLQKITTREQAIGISDEGSWHAKYKDSAYIYVGGLSFDLTEGDVLAVFAQYGEIVDVNLVRDKATGKSKGFAFLAYEDQKSTVLAVDNLNGARVDARTIKVDHVSDYKRKLEEDEEEKQRKREERGVCYAFQRGECKRGDDCKYSHDEQRNANTGWGEGGSRKDGSTWKHDQFDGSMKEAGRRIQMISTKRNDIGMNGREDKPRGVCYAFQRGDCNRGDGCKFAHDEQGNDSSGRGGSGAGSKHDQFDGSMKEASRRSNLASSKGNFSPERNGRENEKFMRPPDDRRGKDDAHRSRDSDRGDQRRDDGSRRRDYEREDRNRDQDRKESDRRGKRDDFNRDERDRRDDRSMDIRKERETSDRGDDVRDERNVRSRR